MDEMYARVCNCVYLMQRFIVIWQAGCYKCILVL